MGWLDEVKAQSLLAVAKDIGLDVKGRTFRPCPACGAERRSRSDGRMPCGVFHGDNGAKCYACGAMMDAIDIVSYVVAQYRFKDAAKDGRSAVRAWFSSHGYVTAKAGYSPAQSHPEAQGQRKQTIPEVVEEVVRPPRDELRALWLASDLPADSTDKASKDFLVSRGYDLEALSVSGCARVLPPPDAYTWPAWWPQSRSRRYRVVTLGYSVETGMAEGMHGRAVWPSESKTRWHNGTAKGLVFCNPTARDVVAKRKRAHGLLVTEGVTDFWAATTALIKEEWPVVGCTAGNFSVLGALDLSEDAEVYVATDPDDQGDRYAREVARALPGRVVLRIPLRSRSWEKKQTYPTS